MIKCVMIQLCRCLFGLSVLGLHVLVCYRLFGLVATLVIVGVQVLVAAWIIYIKIRAPD